MCHFLKRCLLFLAVIGLLMPVALAPAQKQVPPGGVKVKDNLFGTEILSDAVRIIVGDRGKIYRSEDSGNSWQDIPSNTRRPLFDVSFADADRGWICGNRGTILHSGDGGQTWSAQDSGTPKHLFSMDFTDAQHGCAVGDWGAVLLTWDGGSTWQDVSLPEDVVLYGVKFSDWQNGWIAGELGSVFRTRDGGRTWLRVELPVTAMNSFFCVEAVGDSVYLAGLDGAILTSKDAGKSWKWSDYKTDTGLYELAAKGETVWAVGDNGSLAMSNDGGAIWQAINVPEDFKLFWFGSVALNTTNGQAGVSGFFAGANGLRLPIEHNKVLWGPGGPH